MWKYTVYMCVCVCFYGCTCTRAHTFGSMCTCPCLNVCAYVINMDAVTHVLVLPWPGNVLTEQIYCTESLTNEKTGWSWTSGCIPLILTVNPLVLFPLHLQCVQCLYTGNIQGRRKSATERTSPIGWMTWLTWYEPEVMFIEGGSDTLQHCKMTKVSHS